MKFPFFSSKISKKKVEGLFTKQCIFSQFLMKMNRELKCYHKNTVIMWFLRKFKKKISENENIDTIPKTKPNQNTKEIKDLLFVCVLKKN